MTFKPVKAIVLRQPNTRPTCIKTRTRLTRSLLQWMCLWLVVLLSPAPGVRAEALEVRTLSGQTVQFYAETHALVVGVAQYDHWPARPGAVKDARDISRAFKRLGFSVKLLTDPTTQELRSALDEFAQATGAQIDRGLIFYYAGHVYADSSTDGTRTGWIIPADAPQPSGDRQDFEKSAVSTDRIAAIAAQIRSRHALFLFDAALSADVLVTKPAIMKVVNAASAMTTRQFITAGSADEIISQSGLFKRFLLQGWSGQADVVHDGVVSASELALFLADRISRVTRDQVHPQFGTIDQVGDDRGDFMVRPTDLSPAMPRLFVNTEPASATIRILNIKPRFQQGMELEPGRYRLQVSAEGFETVESWIELKADEERTETIQLSKAQKEITNSLGMRFIRIRPGQFLMGSPTNEPGRSSDESLHRVRLTRPFYIQSTEVTVGQFKQFVKATGYKTEAEKSGGCWTTGGGGGWNQKPGTYWEKPGTAPIDSNFPAMCVTWNDAGAFARWLSRKEGRTYRLPTEAQWEYACRAKISTPFSSGRCLSSDEANYARTGFAYQKCTTVFRKNRGRPVKAGQLAPNPWGLYNIHGNVSEWCLDWYGLYPKGNVTNPTGPNSGSERVMRGGHWQADAAGCRSAKRRRFPPSLASDAVGFRLVMVP
jgi:formylglycine-generating enzyme required for sulfatase activity